MTAPDDEPVDVTRGEDAPTWLDDLADYLAETGLGTWSPDGAYPDDVVWPIYLEHLPPEPGRAISLTGYSGDESQVDADPRVQIKVRGDGDPRTSRRRADAIYRHLHHLVGGTALGERRWLVNAPGINGGAISLGVDDLRRHLHVTNHRTTISTRE